MVYSNGVGRHLGTVPPAQVEAAALNLVILQSMASLTIALPKLSFLGLYLRILVEKSHRRAVWIVAAIVSASAIATFFVSIFRCSPTSRAWIAKSVGTCINISSLLIYRSISNLVTDAIILVLPIPMIRKLQIDCGQKVKLFLMLALGSMQVSSDEIKQK